LHGWPSSLTHKAWFFLSMRPVCAGEQPLPSCNHFSKWLQDYFFWVNSKRPALKPWPSPLPFPQALKGLLQEVPVLEQEPTDPGDLRGRTLWKYFHEDKLWWKGLVLSHNSETYQVRARLVAGVI
jgi:hypothetical protein